MNDNFWDGLFPSTEDDNENDNYGNFPFNIPGLFILGKGSPNSNNQKISSIFKNINLLCTIFNDEYGIFLIDKIDKDDNSKYLLECTKMPNSHKESKYDLFSVYEYLESSYFINFLIAKTFNKSVWAYEGINTKIEIVNNDDEKYSKIIIFVETSSIPSYIYEDILLDSLKENNTYIDSTIPNSPLMIKVTKSKSYYRPIIVYDVTFGFNKKSKVNFNNIDSMNFYDCFISSKYINDAILSFYIGIPIKIFNEYKEKLLRVQYIVEYSERLMKVKIICTPTLYYSGSNVISKYLFINDELHMFGCQRLDDSTENIDTKEVSFINNISSSDVSQLIVLSTFRKGIVNEFCEEYSSLICDSLIFTLNREIIRFNKMKEYSNPPKIFTNLLSNESAFNYVDNYWVPSQPILIDTSSSENTSNITKMRIYGFINFNRDELSPDDKFEDVYNDLQYELRNILGITKSDYNHNDFGTVLCYENMNTSRIMLFKFITDEEPKTKNAPNKSAKSKLWRGKN